MGDVFYFDNANSELMALNDGETTILSGYGDAGAIQAQVAADRVPYKDGQVYRGLYTPPRDFSIVLEIVTASAAALLTREDALRRHLSAYAGQGTLRFLRADGSWRYLDCRCIAAPKMSQDRDVMHARRAFVFRADNPHWYDPTLESETIYLGALGGLTFPWFDGVAELAFTETEIDTDADMVNDGELDTWPTVVINGPVDNPAVTNDTTGQTIGVTQTMDVNDTLTFDMAAKTALFYDDGAGTVAEVNLSTGSEYWPLKVGHNLVAITGAGATEGSVVVSWYRYFLGA